MGSADELSTRPGCGTAGHPFVMIASEVNPVIRALEDNDIMPTALHSHMLTENPRLFFMHFWANDDAGGYVRIQLMLR